MFENLAQIRHASRKQLVEYLEWWGTACYDDEPTSLLREAAIDTFKADGRTYKIIRFYRELHKSRRVIKRGLTLEQAKKHCQDPSTRKEGEWFDGFELEGK
jgi:hypothetical protein